MKTKFAAKKWGRQTAYALVTVMVITGASLGFYASIASWSAGSALVNDRNNTYNSAVAAAEGASENVLSYLARDFANQTYDPANLSAYRSLVPTNDWAARYQFRDGAGGTNCTWVTGSSTSVVTNLNSQFAGLYGLEFSASIRAEASPVGTPYKMTAAVEQDLELASIPVFQFMLFYAMDLEINPGPAMKITGKVFSNANLYTAPVTSLEYCDDVMAVSKIHNNRHPDDPTVASKVAPVYDAQRVENVSSLTLPIGTNNSPAAVRAILQVPPLGESPQSPAGQQRYYNNVDLVATITSTNVLVQAGRWDNFLSLPPDIKGTTNTPPRYSFITTNLTFRDQREGKLTLLTDLDVGALTSWMTNSATNGGGALNNAMFAQRNHRLNSIYVNDVRTAAGKLTAVRVANGKQLPSSGLTVATPLPLYVQGHFNAANPGSASTSNALPASLVADAITVLSTGWADHTNTSQTTASDTTVNAAFLAGIVQTTNYFGTKHYSGGAENFPRFLENWSSKTLTYNGSMVVMFPSQYATNFWLDPSASNYYQAPTRQWAFDVNFLDYNKLPPATPKVNKVVRGQWAVVAAQ